MKRFSNRTKHVAVKYYFTSDLKEHGKVDFRYCPTDRNIADMLTKPLKRVKLDFLRAEGNVCEMKDLA